MDDLIIMGETPEATTLYVTELSSFTLRENGLDDAPAGLYLCEESDVVSSTGIRVLAQVPDLGAAFRLRDLIFRRSAESASDTGHAVLA